MAGHSFTVFSLVFLRVERKKGDAEVLCRKCGESSALSWKAAGLPEAPL